VTAVRQPGSAKRSWMLGDDPPLPTSLDIEEHDRRCFIVRRK
jgi:hypothetical protein